MARRRPGPAFQADYDKTKDFLSKLAKSCNSSAAIASVD
jgi:hypothetical protein